MQYRNHFRLHVTLFVVLLIAACGENKSVVIVPPTVQPIIQVAELQTDEYALNDNVKSPAVSLAEDNVSNESAPLLIADTPFNYLIPEWDADVPLGAEIIIRLQTATLTGAFSDWQTIEVSPDASEPAIGQYSGSVVGTGEPDLLHERVAVEVSLLPNINGEMPVLRRLALVYIDSSDGPTTQEILRESRRVHAAAKQLQQAGGGYPKPPVISRAQWCTHTRCNYTGVQYASVTHLIVHHTVSNNSTSDWAANVRAIWTYHTFQKDWGDIGYNYLIDPDGNIYEGHLGGDDVIGTHAAAGNRGGMGVALLGEFGSIKPSAAMIDALVELLAWKADQKNIDLWDSSAFLGLDHGNLHLIGHRDVYGTTACPGALAHHEIDEIRARVAAKINFIPEYTYIDDQATDFSLSQANWYDGPRQCGFNQHAYYTFSTPDAASSVNRGEWRLNITDAGRYQVDAFIPFCNTGEPDSHQSPYTIFDSTGSRQIVRSQADSLGFWMPLGEYNFTPTSNNLVRLDDLTTSEDRHVILYDAIRYKLLDVAATNLNPSPNEWLTDRAVNFSWRLSAGGAVRDLRLQVATDQGFGNLVKDVGLSAETTSSVQTFNQDYNILYWRIVATTFDNAQVISNPTNFHIDATPPVSTITRIIRECDGQFSLMWDGSDNLSNIAHYTVAYRRPFDGDWTTVLANTTQTSVTFAPPDQTSSYQFRVQAVDGRGNVEPLKPEGDATDADAIPCIIDPPVNHTPAVNDIVDDAIPTFSWTIGVPAAVANYLVEVATDAAFNDIVGEQAVPPSADYTVIPFAQDYPQLFWRVTANTIQGGSYTSTPTPFSLDATAPTSAVFDAPSLPNGNYQLQWQGEDNQSGIASYTIEYSTGESWTAIFQNTTATQGEFTPPAPDGFYLFRSQATDRAGNVEPDKPDGDFDTSQSCPAFADPIELQFPVVDGWLNRRIFTFRWAGTASRCVAQTVIEVANDAAFSDVMIREAFDGGRTTYTVGLNEGEATPLFWRVSQTLLSNISTTSEVRQIRFDTSAPTSSIVALTRLDNGDFELRAEGNDGESGIAGYIFEYRVEGENNWVRWAIGEGNTAVFRPEAGKIYWFRSLAIDVAGNIQSADSDGDINSGEPLPVFEQYLPVIRN